MNAGQLSKTWEGIYYYDPVPNENIQPPVTFTLKILPGWFGRFNGSIDEGNGGIPDRAKVRGKITSNVIRFDKHYPRYWSVDEAGKPIVLKGFKPLIVHYDGRVSSDYLTINGVWKIDSESDVIVDGVAYEWPETTGTWKASSTGV